MTLHTEQFKRRIVTQKQQHWRQGDGWIQELACGHRRITQTKAPGDFTYCPMCLKQMEEHGECNQDSGDTGGDTLTRTTSESQG